MNTANAADADLFDAERLICRLEEAGAALLALPGTGWSTRLRGSSLEIVRTAIENYGWTTNRIRPPVPSATQITRMDEAMSWISLIPTAMFCGVSLVPAAWCIPSPSGICSPGAVLPQCSASTTKRCNVGMPRGST